MKALRADIVFVQREAMLIGPPAIEAFISKIMRKPIVLDLDDAVFTPYVSPTYGKWLSKLKWFSKTDYILKNSTHVIAGSEYLQSYALRFNKNVSLIPSAVDTYRMRPNSAKRNSPVPVIGWIGSHSSTQYFKMLLPVLEVLAEKHEFKLKVVGASENFHFSGIDIANLEWSLEREIEDFQSLDIGVYPIVEDEWSVGKCGLKAIQYMAVGVPAVCSPIGVVKQIIQDGVNGYLARTPDEWIEKLCILLDNPSLREKIGNAGRETVERHYSLEKWAPQLLEVIHKCINSKR